MLEIIKTVILLACLFVNAWTDAKTRRVYPALLAVTGTIGLFFYTADGEMTAGSLAAGVLVGVFLLLGGRLTDEKIGYGDGMTFLVTGIFLGFWKNLFLLFAASLAAAVYALIGLALGRLKRNDCLPFLPFVSGAYAAGLLFCR